MKSIAICICTRRRTNGLKMLLDSINNLETLPEYQVRIVIVENDSDNFSEHVIREFSTISKFKLSYYNESRIGIVFARNRSVKESDDCDFCCFVDDDQLLDKKWLVELLKCQEEFDADGVSGSTPPIFTNRVPDYVEEFHKRISYQYGTIRKYANTGCLLMRKKILDMLEGPFDIRLNFTGGEDAYMTSLVTQMGGVIRYNPNAIAFEVIPEHRTTLKYIIKRTYRISNTELLIESLENTKFDRCKAIPRLLMRLFNGLLILIPFLIFGRSKRLLGLNKTVRAIGGFSFIFGITNQFYK